MPIPRYQPGNLPLQYLYPGSGLELGDGAGATRRYSVLCSSNLFCSVLVPSFPHRNRMLLLAFQIGGGKLC